jgi:hypothetical protein
MGMGALILKKYRTRIIAAALLIGIGAWFYVAIPPARVIAQGNISIYDALESAAKEDGKIIRVAKKGDQFTILACHDMKSFFVLEVDIGAGQKGFIIDGDYRMSRMPSCA